MDEEKSKSPYAAYSELFERKKRPQEITIVTRKRTEQPNTRLIPVTVRKRTDPPKMIQLGPPPEYQQTTENTATTEKGRINMANGKPGRPPKFQAPKPDAYNSVIQSSTITTADPAPVEYYRFNAKLPIEQRDYLQEMAWRNRTTITEYLTRLIAADMQAHPEWKETIDILNR